MKAAGEEGMEGVSAFEAYVHRAFAPDGLFSRARDFEYREEQQSMALAVARALQVDAPLLVEAGTGVGKSLGYLLPAVKFALDFRPEGGDFHAYHQFAGAVVQQGYSAAAHRPGD